MSPRKMSLTALYLLTMLCIAGCFRLPTEEETARERRMPQEDELVTADTPNATGDDDTSQAEQAGASNVQPPIEGDDLASVDRDQFIAAMTKRFATVDATLAQIQQRGLNVVPLAQKRWDKTLDQLATDRAELAERFTELKNFDVATWDEARPSLVSGWNQLNQTIEQANAQLERFIK